MQITSYASIPPRRAEGAKRAVATLDAASTDLQEDTAHAPYKDAANKDLKEVAEHLETTPASVDSKSEKETRAQNKNTTEETVTTPTALRRYVLKHVTLEPFETLVNVVDLKNGDLLIEIKKFYTNCFKTNTETYYRTVHNGAPGVKLASNGHTSGYNTKEVQQQDLVGKHANKDLERQEVELSAQSFALRALSNKNL